tara:strand:+ start:104 stop:568 length:465 start_codon:yes stop_codon:yes gene_type:complete
MLKKTLVLILCLFVSACGYEAIYSKKNPIINDFSISELIFNGDGVVNLKIKEKLNNYTLAKKNKSFKLKISSTTEKTVIAKDATGDPTSFKTVIVIIVEVFIKNDFKNTLQIVKNFSYDNNTNKIDLKRYEREIKNNLAETATDELIFKLSKIQ